LIVAGAACPCAPLAAQQKVPLVLNHLVIVLDSATYRDVRNSPFMRDQFAGHDTTEVSAIGSREAVRYFGKYNYFVLVHPAGRGARVGDVEIVLGTEVPGALATLTQAAKLARGQSFPPRDFDGAQGNLSEPIDYLRGVDDVAWPAGDDSTSSQARFRIMQYGDAMAKRLAQFDSLPAADRTNVRFLARYYEPHRLLSHLTSATLAIPAADIAKIARVVERDSVTVLHEGEGVIIKLDGFTLHLIPPWTGAGIKQLQFALTREAVANPVYRFGPHSQLRFGPGPIAVWDFNQR
jgi:hypothetical protein